MSRPLGWSLGCPGAVAGEGLDAGVAVHYGDPYREQRRWGQGEAWVDRSHHGVLRVQGAQRLTWLHSLLTQTVADLAPGQAMQALILTPTGHVEHQVRLVDDGEATWLLTLPGQAQTVERYLRSMVFRSQISVEDLSTQWAVVTQPGRACLPQAHLTFDLQAQPAADLEPARWRDALLPRTVAQLPAQPDQRAGLWAFEAWRVEHGLAQAGLDTDHRTLPHEVGWVGTPAAPVALDKGCYRGQETVARVHNLGRPPRRLVRLHLDGSVERLPTPGAAVHDGQGQPVGRLGTVVRHFELGPIALALVKRTLDVQAPLQVEGIPATQELILPADTTPAVELPRLGSLASRGLTGVKTLK